MRKLDIAIAAEKRRAAIRGDIVQPSPEINDDASDRPQGLYREFLYDVNPISREDWEKSSGLVKAILIVRSPVMFLLQLFIPVVNPTAVKKGWSKLLNCFQLCVTPTITLFLLNGKILPFIYVACDFVLQELYNLCTSYIMKDYSGQLCNSLQNSTCADEKI